MNLFNYDKGRKCLIAEGKTKFRKVFFLKKKIKKKKKKGWCPTNATHQIIEAMRRATESSGALVPSILSTIPSQEEVIIFIQFNLKITFFMTRNLSKQKPPTYFRTNKFTYSFQAIVDSYGVAHYRG